MVAVSVIIPTFNRPDKLRRAIGSVLSQTLEDLEILVINDSNEESPVLNVLDAFNDTRIKYFFNEMSKGASGARNTGIAKAKGEYIAFLDDDDEWMPSKLEVQVQRLESLDGPSWGGCYCGYTLLEGKVWRSVLNLMEGDFLREFLLGKISVCSGSTLMIKREAMKQVGGFDEKLEQHEDIHFVIKFFRYFKLAFVNEVLVKIYGHNPRSAIKFEQANNRLFELIREDVSRLGFNDMNYFFALQYRELSIHFGLEGNINKFNFYLLESARQKFLPPTKYIRVLLAFFDGKFGWNLIPFWNYLTSNLLKIKGGRQR